eukprot:SAG11_NODE_16483_length_546_cov_0.910515_1_plen_67_part_10
MLYGICRNPGEDVGCCGRGPLKFQYSGANKGQYVCGASTDWGTCQYKCTAEIATIEPFEVPDELGSA